MDELTARMLNELSEDELKEVFENMDVPEKIELLDEDLNYWKMCPKCIEVLSEDKSDAVKRYIVERGDLKKICSPKCIENLAHSSEAIRSDLAFRRDLEDICTPECINNELAGVNTGYRRYMPRQSLASNPTLPEICSPVCFDAIAGDLDAKWNLLGRGDFEEIAPVETVEMLKDDMINPDDKDQIFSKFEELVKSEDFDYDSLWNFAKQFIENKSHIYDFAGVDVANLNVKGYKEYEENGRIYQRYCVPRGFYSFCLRLGFRKVY